MRKLEERELVVASHNKGKVREINELLAPYGYLVKSASDHDLPEPEETGSTFEENSAIKAVAASDATGLPALADDSGLCVDALFGQPGIYTADWAERPDGTGRDFAMAMEKVVNALAMKGGQDPGNRGARFVCVLCLAWPDGHQEYFRGEVKGEIVWPPRGNLGFGYDPIFMPDGHQRTFGEMTPDEKHHFDPKEPDGALSHRARSFALFAANCLAPVE